MKRHKYYDIPLFAEGQAKKIAAAQKIKDSEYRIPFSVDSLQEAKARLNYCLNLNGAPIESFSAKDFKRFWAVSHTLTMLGLAYAGTSYTELERPGRRQQIIDTWSRLKEMGIKDDETLIGYLGDCDEFLVPMSIDTKMYLEFIEDKGKKEAYFSKIEKEIEELEAVGTA